MDWIRQWVLQIAGVIVLSSICEHIMIEGEMKKYIKPVLGFVLIFTIIKPITALSEYKLRADILQESINRSSEIVQDVDKTQRAYIIDIYESKLAERLVETIETKFNLQIDVSVTADRSAGKIGDINQVKLTVFAADGQYVNTESIKRYVKDEFGIEDKSVIVTLTGR